MALLGLLRTLEEARPGWRPRASWTVVEPPLRPRLHIVENVGSNAVAEAAAEGLAVLARHHDFDGLRDLTLAPEDAAQRLREAADSDSYIAGLWAALVSDAARVVRGRRAAIARDGKKVEPTPLCFLFGQGHQHFLSRLASVPKETVPLKRGSAQKRSVSEAECLGEALFAPWRRPDEAKERSFRWDPHEDVRYALRANNPTNKKTKEGTQHGANRLAAVGLSLLTVVPRHRERQNSAGARRRRARTGWRPHPKLADLARSNRPRWHSRLARPPASRQSKCPSRPRCCGAASGAEDFLRQVYERHEGRRGSRGQRSGADAVMRSESAAFDEAHGAGTGERLGTAAGT